jgi:hypothetical protein
VLELEFVLVLLVLVLSGRGGFQVISGRRDGKNRRGGMPITFRGGGNGGAEVPVVGVAESSTSASPAVALLSRPDERRREVKSVKSTVRERAGTRRIDGWRVRGGADGGGGTQASGEASRRVPQLSRRVERST